MADRALDILLKVHNSYNTEIPVELIQECYEIEKQYLFEKDGNKRIDLVRQLVERYLEKGINR
jgi:ribonucleotide reductase beta subunit family protein with ferritin-like domain